MLSQGWGNIMSKHHLKYLRNIEKITWEKFKKSLKKQMKFRNEKKQNEQKQQYLNRQNQQQQLNILGNRKS